MAPKVLPEWLHDIINNAPEAYRSANAANDQLIDKLGDVICLLREEDRDTKLLHDAEVAMHAARALYAAAVNLTPLPDSTLEALDAEADSDGEGVALTLPSLQPNDAEPSDPPSTPTSEAEDENVFDEFSLGTRWKATKERQRRKKVRHNRIPPWDHPH